MDESSHACALQYQCERYEYDRLIALADKIIACLLHRIRVSWAAGAPSYYSPSATPILSSLLLKEAGRSITTRGPVLSPTAGTTGMPTIYGKITHSVCVYSLR